MKDRLITRVLLSLSMILALCWSSITLAVEAPGNIRGVEVAQSTVQWTWDAVEDASQYELTLDGSSIVYTESTDYTVSGLWTGDHSLRIRSIDENGEYSEYSRTAKIVVRTEYDPAVSNEGQSIDHSDNSASTGSAGGASSSATMYDDSSEEVTASENQTVIAASTENSMIDPASRSIAKAISRPGYELVFSDEFNASNINSNRWQAQLRWDGEFNGERYEYRVINGEHQFYVNPLSSDSEHMEKIVPIHNPFELDGSRLAIRAIVNPLKSNNGGKRYGSLMEMAEQQDFLSGAISTYDKFHQKYGYFEARIKIPSHVGTFPAFWLYHQKRRNEGTNKMEIDIMENLGHAPWYIYNSFHYNTGVTASSDGTTHFLKPEPEGQIYTGIDYSEDFHTYAVEWSPDRIVWYIDDEQVSELNDSNVNYEELYIILNLAIGGNWTNYGTNAGGLGRAAGEYFPTGSDKRDWANPALEIDYVRVYKRN